MDYHVFATDTNENDVITRYMNLEKFIDLILNKRLYFPTLETLKQKDPHEGKLPWVNQFFSSGRAAKSDYALNKLWARSVGVENTPAPEPPKSPIYKTPFITMEQLSWDEFKKQEKELNKAYGISCWHKGYIENMAMWKIYGENNACVRIKSTIKDLKESLDTDSFSTSMRGVNYIPFGSTEEEDKNKKLTIIPIENDLDRLIFKMQPYRYEQEVRCIIYDKNHFSSKDEDRNNPEGFYINVELGKLIQSVRLSPGTTNNTKKNIQSLITKAGLELQVAKSKLDESYDY